MASTNSVANVTAGKPNSDGGVYRAPLSSNPTLPTDATTALNAAFKGLGYVTDAGMTQSFSMTNTEIKDWGGSTILITDESTTDTYHFVLAEALSLEALKAVFGDANVSGDLANGITVSGNSKAMPAAAWVFELEVAGGGYRRIVLPNAKPTARADVQYVGNNVVGYGITLTCMPDASGNTHYEYTVKT